MNKQELIDKAVHEFGGKWPAIDRKNVCMSHRPENKGTTFYPFYVTDNNYGDYLYWSISEFQQRARELGYINGYRYGVEYPTNGKKPDLAYDVVVYARTNGDECGKGAFVKEFYWSDYRNFKIVDDRYKPADTSYLETPALEPVPQEENWYDYDNQKAIALPPVGDLPRVSIAIADAMNVAVSSGMIDIAKRLQEINKDVLAEANKRKAEAEKKRVVDAAAKKFHTSIMHDYSGQPFLDGLSALYDAGYLKLPTE